MPHRVSPADRVRGHIDELLAQDKTLPEILEDIARLGAQLLMQAALEAEITEFLGRDLWVPETMSPPSPGCCAAPRRLWPASWSGSSPTTSTTVTWTGSTASGRARCPIGRGTATSRWWPATTATARWSGPRRQVRRRPRRALLRRAARACCLVPIGVAGLNAAPVVAGRHQPHGRRACCGRRVQPRTAEPGIRLRARRWWPRPAHRQAPLEAGRPCAAATTAWRTSR